MLFSVEGKRIHEVAYRQEFQQRLKRLAKDDYNAIVNELNSVIDSGDVHTSSWIPGHDWRGTIYEPIWLSCNKNDEVAAKFYGQILYKVFIDRPEKWYFGAYPHAGGRLILGLYTKKLEGNNLDESRKLLNDMHNIYIKAKKECKYNASRFHQLLLSNEDPVGIAKRLTLSDIPSDGFTKLWELKRLDITVEALIYNDSTYHKYFSEDELIFIKENLTKYGYFKIH